MRLTDSKIPESNFSRFGNKCLLSLESSLLLGHIESMHLPRFLSLLLFQNSKFPNIKLSIILVLVPHLKSYNFDLFINCISSLSHQDCSTVTYQLDNLSLTFLHFDRSSKTHFFLFFATLYCSIYIF